MEENPEQVKQHRFYLSYKIDGEVHTGWFQGVHIRFAKDQLLFKYPEATDIMDWTYERAEDLRGYLQKQNTTRLDLMMKMREDISWSQSDLQFI